VRSWGLKLRSWLEVLGGARPVPSSSLAGAIGWGLWWAFLLAITLSTAGRATKFIYVDF
jgi:hypothetical protein